MASAGPIEQHVWLQPNGARNENGDDLLPAHLPTVDDVTLPQWRHLSCASRAHCNDGRRSTWIRPLAALALARSARPMSHFITFFAIVIDLPLALRAIALHEIMRDLTPLVRRAISARFCPPARDSKHGI